MFEECLWLKSVYVWRVFMFEECLWLKSVYCLCLKSVYGWRIQIVWCNIAPASQPTPHLLSQYWNIWINEQTRAELGQISFSWGCYFRLILIYIIEMELILIFEMIKEIQKKLHLVYCQNTTSLNLTQLNSKQL